MNVPGYWMDESSGVLAPVVRRYLNGERLDDAGITVMRSYLQQWINADGFHGADVAALRVDAGAIETIEQLRDWMRRALDAGVDPL